MNFFMSTPESKNTDPVEEVFLTVTADNVARFRDNDVRRNLPWLFFLFDDLRLFYYERVVSAVISEVRSDLRSKGMKHLFDDVSSVLEGADQLRNRVFELLSEFEIFEPEIPPHKTIQTVPPSIISDQILLKSPVPPAHPEHQWLIDIANSFHRLSQLLAGASGEEKALFQKLLDSKCPEKKPSREVLSRMFSALEQEWLQIKPFPHEKLSSPFHTIFDLFGTNDRKILIRLLRKPTFLQRHSFHIVVLLFILFCLKMGFSLSSKEKKPEHDIASTHSMSVDEASDIIWGVDMELERAYVKSKLSIFEAILKAVSLLSERILLPEGTVLRSQALPKKSHYMIIPKGEKDLVPARDKEIAEILKDVPQEISTLQGKSIENNDYTLRIYHFLLRNRRAGIIKYKNKNSKFMGDLVAEFIFFRIDDCLYLFNFDSVEKGFVPYVIRFHEEKKIPEFFRADTDERKVSIHRIEGLPGDHDLMKLPFDSPLIKIPFLCNLIWKHIDELQ